MSKDTEEEHSTSIPPIVYAINSLVMNLAFIAAGIAALYLLYGVFFGLSNFSSWDPQKQRIMVGNIHLATKGLIISLGIASLCATLHFWFEEIMGYLLLIGAVVLGLGLPFIFPLLGGDRSSNGVALALAAFPQASLVPGGIGLLLVIKDVIAKFASAVQRKSIDSNDMTFGAGAKVESKPVRTSLLGKCWEGSYCRDWVRPHCPIYQKKATCWKIRRGCYCEQEIVSAAANKAQGMQLEMAPASQYNFANPSAAGGAAPVRVLLSDEQKKERCRHCVIYNDHQSEKYKVMMPIVIVGMIALCALLSPFMRQGIASSVHGIEQIASRLAFAGSEDSALKLTRPNETVQWALVGAFSLMIVSKALHILEWCVFEKKI